MYMQQSSNPFAVLPVLSGAAGPGCGAGLGCAGCAGKCGGMGIFDTADFSAWGWKEYAVLLVGAYALSSVVFTTKRATTYVAGAGERRRKSQAKRLRQELKSLEA